jgi:hypothetical protein
LGYQYDADDRSGDRSEREQGSEQTSYDPHAAIARTDTAR